MESIAIGVATALFLFGGVVQYGGDGYYGPPKDAVYCQANHDWSNTPYAQTCKGGNLGKVVVLN